jgi:hypothetical protein
MDILEIYGINYGISGNIWDKLWKYWKYMGLNHGNSGNICSGNIWD